MSIKYCEQSITSAHYTIMRVFSVDCGQTMPKTQLSHFKNQLLSPCAQPPQFGRHPTCFCFFSFHFVWLWLWRISLSRSPDIL